MRQKIGNQESGPVFSMVDSSPISLTNPKDASAEEVGPFSQ